MNIELPVSIERQPDYTTCGPTSLQAVEQYVEQGGTYLYPCSRETDDGPDGVQPQSWQQQAA